METVLTTDVGPVRVLATRCAPGVELAEAIEGAMVEDAVRAVVLTCFPDGSPPRPEAAQWVVRAIVDGPKPVVAAVEGLVVGAGLGIVIACDRVVAASGAWFRTSSAGDPGIAWALPRRARKKVLLPTDVRGRDAADIGLVDRIVGPGEALAAAIDDAGRLAAGPPSAMAAIKAMLNRGPADVSSASPCRRYRPR